MRSTARAVVPIALCGAQAEEPRHYIITSIRNHTVGEHPEVLFVRVWGQGSAADLAKALRYTLDVEVGAVRLPAQ